MGTNEYHNCNQLHVEKQNSTIVTLELVTTKHQMQWFGPLPQAVSQLPLRTKEFLTLIQ